MASKETTELIIEALDFYMNSLKDQIKDDLSMDLMRKLVKIDDIKLSLEKKSDE